MSTMVNAGPPAPPGHQTPRLRPLPGGQPTGHHSPTPSPLDVPDGTTPPRGDAKSSPFDRLTAAASFRVPTPEDGPDRDGNRSWHDPDPGAGSHLGEGRTPYDRALNRWADGVSRSRARTRFRMAKRLLVADMDTPVEAQDLRAFPWHQLSVEDAQDFHRAVYRRYDKQSSRNDIVCPLRAIVVQCYATGLISALRREELLEALNTLAPGRSTRRHRITDDEFDALMEVCLTTGTAFARARNSAIIALFRTTGLRVSELTRIDLCDWDRREDTIHLRMTKNADPHTLFLHPGTKALLVDWLAVRGTKPGKLFCSMHGPIDRAMTPSSVRYMLANRCDVAGIPHFGTHDFRRTFATEMLRQYDAALVSKLLNHRKLSSTLIYDMSTDDEMRHAVASIALGPFHEGGAA
ncbi:Phage integrase family protein [Nocardioides exalbidus]|uniref:Phage integrase family protein n=1 Tax=Nocardioides exalbidus TaxID=402596 RepID=A0A1H4WSR1_9ACTN|nr:Phage integrase family protein [Nocardioides exalbidus]